MATTKPTELCDGSASARATEPGNAAIAEFRARYRTLSDACDRPTGGLTTEQVAILSALPASSPMERDAWWRALRERLDAI